MRPLDYQRDDNMINGCEACIAYQVQKGIAKPDLCENCGKQEMSWRQSAAGTLYMECSNCHDTIAVDLNTPCELDPVFGQKVKVTVEPQQRMPEKEAVSGLSKAFKVNALGMVKLLKEGISMEVSINELEVMISLMDRFGVRYSLENYEDCKVKYSFYKDCKYPYSAMRIFMK